VKSFLECMAEQYNPSPETHTKMTAIFENSYGPNISDEKFDEFIQYAEGCYKQQDDNKVSEQRAREQCEEIGANLIKMGEHFEMVSNYAVSALTQMTETIKTAEVIKENMVSIDRSCEVMNDNLEQMKSGMGVIKEHLQPSPYSEHNSIRKKYAN